MATFIITMEQEVEVTVDDSELVGLTPDEIHLAATLAFLEQEIESGNACQIFDSFKKG